MMMQNQQEFDRRREWERQEKEDHLQVAAKMMEFMGVVLGVVCIFVLLALLFSLISWLNQDISSTFSILRTRFQ